MKRLSVGFAMCGSFCTLRQAVDPIAVLRDMGADVTPIMSPIVHSTDTRFGTAADFKEEVERLCGKKIIHTVKDAEPIGPRNLLDVIVAAPCTGTTLGKLAGGITDTSVLMAIKAQVRNDRPVVIALSTNDALGTAAINIGGLLNRRNLYFVPFSQDDHEKKPRSMAARFGLCEATMEAALEGRQAQPLIL